MLSSEHIIALSERVILAVVRRNDAQGEALRKEFFVPFLNSWVVVLDGKGETLASWIGDAAGAGCTRRSVSKFPAQMAARIRKSLRCKESLQEMERRWRKDPSDLAAFDAYSDRLQAMHAFDRLRQICQEQATDSQLSDQQRNEFRLRAFLARARGHGSELDTRTERARFASEGEKLLIELADHPRAADLPDALFIAVYAHTFDVPSRSAKAVARLEKAADRRKKPVPLRQRIRQLAGIRRDWIKQMKEILQKVEEPSTKQLIAASLGDARAAIELFSRPGYRDVPEYREQLRDAKKKLREKKRVGTRAQ